MNRNKTSARQYSAKKTDSKKYSKDKSRMKDRDKTGKGAIPDKEADKYNNNPNWYFEDPILMDQATQITFNQFLGQVRAKSNDLVPTIMVLEMNPSPGVAKAGDQTAGINMAAQRIYAQLSAFTGRTSTYAPQDISTLILIMGELLSLISHVRRVFGCLYPINQRNRAVPELLINALGVDYDDLTANVSRYRVLFNTIITRANKIPFPINIAYLAKCNDMYNNIYLDEESSMAQMYVIRPYSTWDFDETSSPDGTKLVTHLLPKLNAYGSWINGTGKMQDWLDLLNNLVTSLLTSSTLNIIYADILNYATKQQVPLFSVPLLEEFYSIAPVHDEGILEQIHNARVMGEVGGTASYPAPAECTPANDVLPEPNTNTVRYQPCFTGNTLFKQIREFTGENGYTLDFFDDKPDVVRKCEATRMVGALDYSIIQGTGTSAKIAALTVPDHYVVEVVVFFNGESFKRVGGPSTPVVVFNLVNNEVATNGNAVDATTYNAAAYLSQFKHAPVLTYTYVTLTSGAVTSVDGTIRYGELDYYTKVTDEWLKRGNDLISLSLFSLR